MKRLNRLRLTPLVLIIIGSCLLAFPGAYGSIFLFAFAAEGLRSNPLSLLIPLPALIGYSLLTGYFWTLFRKKFVGWFWLASPIFNAVITVIVFFWAALYVMQQPRPGFDQVFILLFLFWTSFVAAASGYYFRHSRRDMPGKINLP